MDNLLTEVCTEKIEIRLMVLKLFVFSGSESRRYIAQLFIKKVFSVRENHRKVWEFEATEQGTDFNYPGF